MSCSRGRRKVILFSASCLAFFIFCLTGHFALAARLADMEEQSPVAEQLPPATAAPVLPFPPQDVYPAPEAPAPAAETRTEGKDFAEQKAAEAPPQAQIQAKETVTPISPPAKAKPAAKAKRTIEEKYVTLDFDNVDITVFIKFISELTGQNFIIDDRVKGKATIISPRKIPIKDVYKVFLSVLEVNGFATVSVGG